MIKDLKEKDKALKEIDNALNKARRMSNPAGFTVKVDIPSDYFWHLLKDLETRIVQYENRTKELTEMLSSRGKGGRNRAPMQSIVAILCQQHRAFKAIAALVAETHSTMNELHEQFKDWHVTHHGDVPRDFEQEDNKERERRRKLFRKVEEQAVRRRVEEQAPNLGTQSMPPNQQGGLFGSNAQQQQQQQGGLFGNTTSPAATTGGLFGTNSQQQSAGGLFGASTQPQQQSLFGSTQSSQPSNNLFGNTSTSTALTTSTSAPAPLDTSGSGNLFGAPAVPSTPSASSAQKSLFDSAGTNSGGAPRKPKSLSRKKGARRG
jgi:hypothetical protein